MLTILQGLSEAQSEMDTVLLWIIFILTIARVIDRFNHGNTNK